MAPYSYPQIHCPVLEFRKRDFFCPPPQCPCDGGPCRSSEGSGSYSYSALAPAHAWLLLPLNVMRTSWRLHQTHPVSTLSHVSAYWQTPSFAIPPPSSGHGRHWLYVLVAHFSVLGLTRAGTKSHTFVDFSRGLIWPQCHWTEAIDSSQVLTTEL